MTIDKKAIAAAFDDVETVILELCDKRGPGKTICPSEAARALVCDGGDWRSMMEVVRDAGRALSRKGYIEVTQRGQTVDIATAKGPIRFGLARR